MSKTDETESWGTVCLQTVLALFALTIFAAFVIFVCLPVYLFRLLAYLAARLIRPDLDRMLTPQRYQIMQNITPNCYANSIRTDHGLIFDNKLFFPIKAISWPRTPYTRSRKVLMSPSFCWMVKLVGRNWNPDYKLLFAMKNLASFLKLWKTGWVSTFGNDLTKTNLSNSMTSWSSMRTKCQQMKSKIFTNLWLTDHLRKTSRCGSASYTRMFSQRK